MLAYVRLALNSSDDVSFLRVLSRPARPGLGPNSLARRRLQASQQPTAELEFEKEDGSVGAGVRRSLWELAEAEVGEAGALRPGARRELVEFLAAVRRVRAAAERQSVADVLRLVCKTTGYAEFRRRESANRRKAAAASVTAASALRRKEEEEEEKPEDEDEHSDASDNEAAGDGAGDVDAATWIPRPVRLLVEDAEAARAALIASRCAAASAAGAGPASLLELCSARLLAGDVPDDAIVAALPAFMAEELYYREGRGLRAIEEFLARLDLQQRAPDRAGPAGGGGGSGGGRDAVQIMTVHQAKGLEWPVVFVPRFNDGFFPNAHGRPPAGARAEYHPPACAAPVVRARFRQPAARFLLCCGRDCAGLRGLRVCLRARSVTAGWAADGRGDRDEDEDELAEEHRLAHVAFTRARDRLVVSRVRRLVAAAGPGCRQVAPSRILLPPDSGGAVATTLFRSSGAG